MVKKSQLRNLPSKLGALSRRRRSSRMAAPALYLAAAVLLAGGAVDTAQAQVQRSFLNLGFEQPPVGCSNSWNAVPSSLIPGWETTHPVTSGNCGFPSGNIIEIMPSGFLGVPARAGTQFAELNAVYASRVYQNVCIVPGDQIAWRFSHRGRDGTDVMEFKIGATGNRVVQASTNTAGAGGVVTCFNEGDVTNNTCSSTQAGTWRDYSGSFTWTGAAAMQQFGFEAISSATGDASAGNFLDQIQLEIQPFVELEFDTGEAREGDPSSALPKLAVSANLTAPLTVDIAITGGTATLGTDYTTPGGGSTFTVTVPAGTYAGQLFPLGMAIVDDDVNEPNETITFEIVPDTSRYIVASTQTCGDPAVQASTYTILDEHLSVEKAATLNDADGNGLADAGETVDYAFKVTNTGGVELTDITIDDPLLTVPGTIASLMPGASDDTTFSVSYTLTQADIDAGELVNQAEASAKTPSGETITDLSDDPNEAADVDVNADGEPDDPTVVPLPKNAAHTLVKEGTLDDADGSGFAEAGETINYTFTVKNTGNVTLTDIAVSDDKATISGSPIASLDPGEEDATSVTGTYVLTQADIDGGSFANTATSTAKDPDGGEVTADSSPPGGTPGEPTVIGIPENATSDFVKEAVHDDANGNGLVDAGEVINYTFTVENTGNVSLTDIVVTDTKATVSGSPIAGPLAPGDSDTSVTGTYMVTQADVDAGTVDNVAEMRGKTPSGNDVSRQSRPPGGEPGETTEFPVVGAPEIDLVKAAALNDANGNGIADTGETIDYTFTVENTGNVTVSGITVSDDKATMSGGPITLAPGDRDETSFIGVYTITQADIDAGSFENVAEVSGKDPKGGDVTAQSRTSDGAPGDPTVIAFEQRPDIVLEVTDTLTDPDSDAFPDMGEPVAYTIKVRNTGNVTVTNVAIARFDVTSVSVVSPAAAAGPRVAVPVSGTIASLAPGAEDATTLSASYGLTQQDIEDGKLAAVAEVTASAPDGDPVSDLSDDPDELTDANPDGDGDPDDPTVTLLPHLASLALEKAGAYQGDPEALAQAGDTVLYTFEVLNDGNIELTGVVPQDAGPRFDGHPGTGSLSAFAPAGADLPPGERQTFTATYTLSAADIGRVQGVEDGIRNVATATGTGLKGEEAVSPEAAAIVELPGFAISKIAEIAEVRRGGRVPYTIRVKPLGISGPTVVNIVDQAPVAFAYVAGTATLAGAPITPRVEGRRIVFEKVTLVPDEEVEIELSLVATASAKPDEYVNSTWVEDLTGKRLSRVATAVVEVVVEAIFDCGDILGKVFDDKNRNGYQDAGEPGLPGVRVATVKGLLVTSDRHGRFHVACADLPDQRIGTNYILKLDPRSLPSGYRITTENPRVVRLTAGKASEFAFGAAIGRVVRLELTAEAFEEGQVVLSPEWQARLGEMIALLDREPSVLRLSYAEPGGSGRLARQRLGAVRRAVAERWRTIGGRYRLEVETSIDTTRRRAMSAEPVYK